MPLLLPWVDLRGRRATMEGGGERKGGGEGRREGGS